MNDKTKEDPYRTPAGRAEAWVQQEAARSKDPKADLAIALANQQMLSAEKGKAISQLQDAKERIKNLEAQLVEPRRPLADFVALMEQQLRNNDHKPGWATVPEAMLFACLLEKAAELHRAILDGRGIPKKAADVANFSMMIADQWNKGDGYGG